MEQIWCGCEVKIIKILIIKYIVLVDDDKSDIRKLVKDEHKISDEYTKICVRCYLWKLLANK